MSTKPTLLGNEAIQAGIKAGNINTGGTMATYTMDLSAESQEAQLKHAESLRRYEAQQRARGIVVPTAIEDVKQKLRELGHVVTLFGENHADRRERLREVIARLELDENDSADMQEFMTSGMSEQKKKDVATASQKELFYSPASDELIACRKYLSDFSFARTKDRLAKTRKIRDDPQLQIVEDQHAAELYMYHKDVQLDGSQFCDTRPLTCVRYSSDDSIVATSSLNTSVKLWNGSSLEFLSELSGHEERVTSLAWRPRCQTNESFVLATTSADSYCCLWDCRSAFSCETNVSCPMEIDGTGPETTKPKPICRLEGHEGVVTRCSFHPSGYYIGTTGEDYTWRLWDVETNKALLLQDGHIRGCDAIAFHNDGSLILTGDLGGVALLWDLRSGQSIHAFQGHIKKIVAASFSPSGYQVATGSTDNMVRVWDIRSKKCGYALPAHSKSISDVRFSSSGELLTTCSFDGTLKIWNARNFDIIRTLSGHSGKVMSCDISSDEKSIVSGGFDRTLKSWKKEAL